MFSDLATIALYSIRQHVSLLEIGNSAGKSGKQKITSLWPGQNTGIWETSKKNSRITPIRFYPQATFHALFIAIPFEHWLSFMFRSFFVVSPSPYFANPIPPFWVCDHETLINIKKRLPANYFVTQLSFTAPFLLSELSSATKLFKI